MMVVHCGSWSRKLVIDQFVRYSQTTGFFPDINNFHYLNTIGVVLYMSLYLESELLSRKAVANIYVVGSVIVSN